MSNENENATNEPQPRKHQNLRAILRLRYRIDEAIETVTGVLSDSVPDGKSWGDHELFAVFGDLVDIDGKLEKFAASLEAQGADIEKDDPIDFNP